MADDSPFTVDAEWLESRLGQPGITIVDASWYLPAQNRDARAEYQAAHIPGAVFLDQDAISDPDSPLPHTLATPQYFAQFVGGLGISADDTIVVYDGPGFFSAPRAWWMFRVMGVFQVYVLDGGFDGWKAAGRPVTAEPTKIAPCVFRCPPARPLCGHGARAPAGSAFGSYSGRAQCAGHSLVGKWSAAAERSAEKGARRRRPGPLEAGRYLVRFGHHGGGYNACPGNARSH